MDISIFTASTLVVLIVALGTYSYHIITVQDANEPPQAHTYIPFFGHAIGLMRSSFNYYVHLSRKIKSEIFTMNLPGQKMYVVTSPDLIKAVQKQYKTLAFPPIEARFSTTASGASAEAHKILLNNLNGDEGEWGISVDIHEAMRVALHPGPALDTMNRIMIQNVQEFLDEIKPAAGQKKRVSLVGWLRHAVTLATTNSVYGPKNPYKDDAIADAFWHFEKDLIKILMGVLTSWTARKGLAGRAAVAEAFKQYFDSESHKEGSMLVQKRYDVSTKYGLSVADIACFEVGVSIAALVNTAPAVFWMLFLVQSHPGLLASVREEIEAMVTVTSGPDGPIRSVNITDLKENSPLLLSTFQETLRFRSMGISLRSVMEDTILQDKWLLKKDGIIQMPTRVVHMNTDIWGTTADKFEPRRFMKDSTLRGKNAKRPSPATFRAFGGGTTLCPGRHFATNEMLVIVVMFVLRYDMVPVSGGWELPSAERTNIAAVMMEPDHEVEVEIKTREGYEDTTWAFELKDSEKIFAVTAEDRGD